MPEKIMSQVNEELNLRLMVINPALIGFQRIFFQMAGTISLFKYLFMPFIGKASGKQSFAKYSEHTSNFATGSKSFWCMDMKLFHLNLMPPDSGEL